MPKINHYNPTTYFHTHTTDAEQDPCEPARWLVPAFATMKTLLEPRDGLVNRYNPETKLFELAAPPMEVQEKPSRPELATQAVWMVDIAKRPAKVITEGTNYCNYVCANAGFTDLPQLETMAEQFGNGNASELAERAHRFMQWRVECLGAVADLAAGLRTDSAVYPPSLTDMILSLPKAPSVVPETEPEPVVPMLPPDGQ